MRAGIVGGTGYTGVELLRLAALHPDLELHCITSRAEAGLRVDRLFPNLRGHCDLAFEAPENAGLEDCEVVFFATPHGVALESAARLLAAGVRVVDLSADFRLRDVSVWEKWYGQRHTAPELVAEAVYGLPEVNRVEIASARLVAVPGCYPTSVQLGFLPLLEANLVDSSRLIASVASGVSGAGRQAKIDNLLTEVSDSLKAYGVGGHRHLPEIEQGLQRASALPVGLTFVPHLAPMIRGIHATLFATLEDRSVDLQALFENRYRDEAAVDVLPAGEHPQTRSVRGTNLCRIAVHRPLDRDVVVVLSVIDNLVKGAAGQALQNFNIMFGLPEQAGLDAPALLP
ncbi:MAG TPA: N-acetyl-gamma-glutamyl-phosphate reductase [Pseudomonadales bacterium]|nr:N-acetyl-gamma-glutamyl-phosphate reductase [Pseudomonadales bacterium]